MLYVLVMAALQSSKDMSIARQKKQYYIVFSMILYSEMFAHARTDDFHAIMFT